MPRRGEYQREFVEDPAEPSADVERVGRRRIRAAKADGIVRELWFDPAGFRCRPLAAELADEWVEYFAASPLSYASGFYYRQAMTLLCSRVDEVLGERAAAASLGVENPDVSRILAEWERTLSAAYSAGSHNPATLSGNLRTLVNRRVQHPERPVVDAVVRVVAGPRGVMSGGTQELDEFSRQDKRALVRAAWREVNALEKRLAAGWALAEQGRDPRTHGWLSIPNLLWGLSRGAATPREIRDELPQRLPPELLQRLERGGRTYERGPSPMTLVRWLVAQLYPDDLDLHGYRVLLMDATGLRPEEAEALTEEDVEFVPGGVRLAVVSKRARRRGPRVFRDGPDQEDEKQPVTEVLDRPRREASAVARRLIAVTERSRGLTGRAKPRLFAVVLVSATYHLVARSWDSKRPDSCFAAWLAHCGMDVSGAPDIRRLRKSTKVEKAIAYGGRIADAADDHHEETFRGHYAQGTTLRVLSGTVITTAQQHWLSQALDGPTVVTDAEPDTAELHQFGLTAEEAEQMRQGELDMGVAHCRNPFDSPFSAAGELCAVAPLRCLECRNAWVMPSHLPQLLLLQQHLDRLRLRLTPVHFHAQWGQSYANLRSVLNERTDAERQLALAYLERDGITLDLPLFAQVEFDR